MKIFFLLLFLPVAGFAQQENQYTNLVMEGGGIRGVAYAGAFKVLEEKGVMQHIENVAGSSAGAIAGLMLAVGYNADEIDSILKSVPFQEFNDGHGGLYGKYKRVKKKFGIYKGDKFEKWLRELVDAKTGNAGLTFRELHEMKLQDKKYRDLYCTGTNISRQRLEVFSFLKTPELSIATAVRISGGIPLYFTPIALDDSLRRIKTGDTTSYINYYVDGGMLCNYPVSMFDSCKAGGEPLLCDDLTFNPHTLGIKLERQEQIDSFLRHSIEIPKYTPKNISDYMGAFTNLTMETMARKYPGLQNEMGRSIYISYGNVNPKIRKMSDEDKQMLYDNGVKGATQFFDNFTQSR
jgi:NTE family protein